MFGHLTWEYTVIRYDSREIQNTHHVNERANAKIENEVECGSCVRNAFIFHRRERAQHHQFAPGWVRKQESNAARILHRLGLAARSTSTPLLT